MTRNTAVVPRLRTPFAGPKDSNDDVGRRWPGRVPSGPQFRFHQPADRER